MVVTLSGCSDVVTSHYETYLDAIEDDLFMRGWLPEILPQSTTNIKTSNNIDLNTSRGYFNLKNTDIAKFKSWLIQMPDGKYSYSNENVENGPTWWFDINTETGHVTYEMSLY